MTDENGPSRNLEIFWITGRFDVYTWITARNPYAELGIVVPKVGVEPTRPLWSKVFEFLI